MVLQYLWVCWFCSYGLWSFMLVSCYFSICVYLHIPKYRSFFIFRDHWWFMFIPLVWYLDVVVLTCFPMCICIYATALCLWIYSVFAHSGQPETMWSMVSSYVLHALHIGSVLCFIILAWYDLVAKLLSCAAIISPSVAAFSPVLLSHYLVLFWSTSASLVLFGYLPWSALSSHFFDNLSWALCFVLCFVLFAYRVVNLFLV